MPRRHQGGGLALSPFALHLRGAGRSAATAMTVVTVMACIACVWSLLVRGVPTPLADRLAAYVPQARIVKLCVLSLVPILLAEVANSFAQNRLENGPPYDEWMRTLPIPVYDDRTELPSTHALCSMVTLACGIAGTFSLGIIFAALRRDASAVSKRTIGIVAAFLAAVSIAAPAMSSTDPYEYVATSLLGLQSYAPHAHVFDGTMYAPYALEIPLHGVIYGPLWVFIDVAQSVLGTSVLAKLVLLRVTNVVLLWFVVFLLRRAGVSWPVRAVVAVNPAVWYFAVVTPHADVQGLAFVVGAWIAARGSRTFVASALLGCAALIKVPFLLVGAVVFASLHGLGRRSLAIAGAVAILVTGSLLAGAGFSHDLASYVAHASGHAHAKARDGWLVVASLAAISVGALLVRRKSLFGVAWFFGQIAPLAAPWYLFWGLPYAAVTGGLAALAIAMPLATALVDPTSRLTIPGVVLACLLAAVLANDAYRATRAVGQRARASG